MSALFFTAFNWVKGFVLGKAAYLFAILGIVVATLVFLRAVRKAGSDQEKLNQARAALESAKDRIDVERKNSGLGDDALRKRLREQRDAAKR